MSRPTAVIIKGNPKVGKKHQKRFYAKLAELLTLLGYDVSFDAGLPYTTPPKADLWVGHSRGADRLRFAPKGTRTIALGSTLQPELMHPKDFAHQRRVERMAKSYGLDIADIPPKYREPPPQEHFALSTQAIIELFR